MKITLLGTGSSMADKNRAQMSILFEHKGEFNLLDIGSGALRRLMELEIDFKKIKRIFFTHFHVDHSSDFATLVQTMWLEDFSDTLEIYGPQNITQWYDAVFNGVYPYLKDKIKIKVNPLQLGDAIKFNGITVKTIKNKHGDTPSLAYLISFDDKRVLYSGDTVPTNEIIEAATGIDLLIHELAFPDSLKEKSTVHTVTSQMAEILEKANPKSVILVHIYPMWFAEQEHELETLQKHYSGNIIIGTDKQIINL